MCDRREDLFEDNIHTLCYQQKKDLMDCLKQNDRNFSNCQNIIEMLKKCTVENIEAHYMSKKD